MAKYKYVAGESKDSKPKYLKDSVVTKVFRNKDNKDYFLRVLRAAFKDEEVFTSDQFELIDIRIGEKDANTHSEADVVVENDQVILNVEINYQISRTTRTDNKNMSYMCWLILKQLPNGKRNYDRIKPVYQLNLNLYDQFGKGEFIYKSVMMEKKYHLTRSEFINITDINLDYLLKLDYDYVKDLSDDSLEKCLYVLICNDKNKLGELYVGDDTMERVLGQLYDFYENGDEYLFYDHEEFKKLNAYDIGKEEGRKVGLAEGKAEGLAEGHKEGHKEGLAKGIAEGKAEGRTEGIKEKQKDVIKNMLDDNLDIKVIAKYVNLDINEMEEVIKEIRKEENK